MMKVGLNLFSIRTLIKTEEQFLETAKKLKKMGYDFIQFSGTTYDPEMIKRVSTESGLPVVLTHVALDKILNEPEKLVEEHNSFGCKNIGLGGLNNDIMKDDVVWKETLDKLNVSAEKIAKLGSKFFFGLIVFSNICFDTLVKFVVLFPICESFIYRFNLINRIRSVPTTKQVGKIFRPLVYCW